MFLLKINAEADGLPCTSRPGLAHLLAQGETLIYCCLPDITTFLQLFSEAQCCCCQLSAINQLLVLHHTPFGYRLSWKNYPPFDKTFHEQEVNQRKNLLNPLFQSIWILSIPTRTPMNQLSLSSSCIPSWAQLSNGWCAAAYCWLHKGSLMLYFPTWAHWFESTISLSYSASQNLGTFTGLYPFGCTWPVGKKVGKAGKIKTHLFLLKKTLQIKQTKTPANQNKQTLNVFTSWILLFHY